MPFKVYSRFLNWYKKRTSQNQVNSADFNSSAKPELNQVHKNEAESLNSPPSPEASAPPEINSFPISTPSDWPERLRNLMKAKIL